MYVEIHTFWHINIPHTLSMELSPDPSNFLWACIERYYTYAQSGLSVCVCVCQQLCRASQFLCCQREQQKVEKFPLCLKGARSKEMSDPTRDIPGPKEGSGTRSTHATSSQTACGRQGCLRSLFWIERHMASPYPANMNTI